MALQGPRPRAKSPALQARLAELQRKLDQHQYDTMLQGIAEKVVAPGSLICAVSLLDVGAMYSHNSGVSWEKQAHLVRLSSIAWCLEDLHAGLHRSLSSNQAM